ncbi:putative phosphatase regulatory subunit-domain-containing protein [Choanephora cucurbitarum]|nr:putative phosphatase regulatory subunit-domain-containing protein [Choanephora cucurbitarum]
MLYQKRVNLIKRPPLIRSTTFNQSTDKPKKSVRFCESGSLENVRLFLKTEMPKACQSDPPLYPTFSLHSTNWPSQPNPTVQLDQLDLLQDSDSVYLDGSVQVANLAFEKHITVYYTWDHWQTTETAECVYQQSSGTWDIFRFNIQLHPTHLHLSLAVNYRVNGHEFWDNNENRDYQFDIVPEEESSDSDDEAMIVSLCHQQKPLSPPLSPTTPVDASPVWSDRSYFEKQHSSRFNTIHEFIQHYYPSANPMLPTSPKAVLS